MTSCRFYYWVLFNSRNGFIQLYFIKQTIKSKENTNNIESKSLQTNKLDAVFANFILIKSSKVYFLLFSILVTYFRAKIAGSKGMSYLFQPIKSKLMWTKWNWRIKIFLKWVDRQLHAFQYYLETKWAKWIAHCSYPHVCDVWLLC